MAAVRLSLPLRVVSESNQRQHWATKAKRAKAQRQAVAWAWRLAGWPSRCKPVQVLLVRLAPGRLDDDNLAGAFKAVRDQIAAECGFDDGDESVRWVYEQERAKEYGVRVEVLVGSQIARAR